MRPGEVSGLKVGDVGQDRIHTKRRIYRGNASQDGQLKSRRGRREVPLAPGTRALIQEYLKLLADDRPDAWLFPSEKPDHPLDYRNLFYRNIRPALIRNGLGHINYQAMRRTFSSLCEDCGISLQTRSEIMGHDTDVDANEYTQTPFDAKLRAMQQLENWLH